MVEIEIKKGMSYNRFQDGIARVSITNYHGHVLFDNFIIPECKKITDYRTEVSGVRA
jgi:RNA exonuclease 4